MILQVEIIRAQRKVEAREKEKRRQMLEAWKACWTGHQNAHTPTKF